MDKSLLKSKLEGLIEEIGSVSITGQDEIIGISRNSTTSTAHTQSPIVQGAMDHLRIRVKYLLFDLEATRRENLYLRKLLEEAD